MIKFNRWTLLLLIALLMTTGTRIMAQTEPPLFGEPSPAAPELAARGDFGVGVTRLELVDPDRVNVLGATADDPLPLYDRPLTVDVWYPALIPADAAEITVYEDNLGRLDQNNLRPFTFRGRAFREALPDSAGAPYPLVIVSHGYPGSSLAFTYLTEHLASRGYVVASIAHTDSTFTDTGAFGSTLLNRSLDQLFTVDALAGVSAGTESRFLSGMIDADNTALVGYSMGGYGALNAIGAGYNGFAANFGATAAYAGLTAGNEDYAALRDDRIKAAVLFAPWGGDLGFIGLAGVALWAQPALADVTIPTFWVVGSRDDVSGFAGVERLFNWAVNSPRHMLVYENALHNVAVNPSPEVNALSDYERYADPVWNSQHMNDINRHFITAFLDQHLRGQAEKAAYFDLIENSNDGVYSVAEGGAFNADHTYWLGFQPRTALGLRLIAGQ